MTMREQAVWWLLGLIILIILLVLLSNVLLPFVLAAGIAYFTDPLADRLERRGLSRVLATVIVTAVAFIVATIALIILIPLLINQIQLAIDAAPELFNAAREFVETRVAPLFDQDGALGAALTKGLNQAQSQIKDISVGVLQGAWSVSLAGFQVVALMVVTPVVAFYLLLDWDNMIARIDDMLPRQHRDEIRWLAGEVDRVLAGFVRGQVTVCLILGGFYALALTLIQLPFGLLVGFFAGLISFIPFVGSIFGGALSVGIALFYFWNDPVWVVATAAIFAAGQAVEGNFLTPKLVGGSVGLHPVWLMFALSAFGALFGFTGLLIAVPAAAVIGVFLRFSIGKYKQGALYRGQRGDSGP
ncbi:AI-2E family transporter [Pikeienuella piscinae]|uniref:AI-2E family transporter n=1 Tax=Pikeienuella piscinae TaxID=2748098 RepID=A0A7L5BUM1_9RHOB|nr:AI-2E family transporter [Pikeienuella piscinae]QIE54713.1 AI-2E family transporter [Pikeienuella piscinae]